jgi:hypothetical protein
MSSILNDIKKLFGLPENDTSFDTDLVININSVFTILKQLGVGPDEGFKITGADEEWSEYLPEGEQLELVKTYIYLRVKLMFDISTMTSPLIDIVKNQISEYEWRLNVAADPGW